VLDRAVRNRDPFGMLLFRQDYVWKLLGARFWRKISMRPKFKRSDRIAGNLLWLLAILIAFSVVVLIRSCA